MVPEFGILYPKQARMVPKIELKISSAEWSCFRAPSSQMSRLLGYCNKDLLTNSSIAENWHCKVNLIVVSCCNVKEPEEIGM
jgi:hypothetical protein